MTIKKFLIGLGASSTILPTALLAMTAPPPPTTYQEYLKLQQMYGPFYNTPPKKPSRGYASPSIEVRPNHPPMSSYVSPNAEGAEPLSTELEPLSTEEPAPSQEKMNKNFDQPPEPMQKQEITPRLIIIPEE